MPFVKLVLRRTAWTRRSGWRGSSMLPSTAAAWCRPLPRREPVLFIPYQSGDLAKTPTRLPTVRRHGGTERPRTKPKRAGDRHIPGERPGVAVVTYNLLTPKPEDSLIWTAYRCSAPRTVVGAHDPLDGTPIPRCTSHRGRVECSRRHENPTATRRRCQHDGRGVLQRRG